MSENLIVPTMAEMLWKQPEVLFWVGCEVLMIEQKK
jgi:hypothetical protein